MQVIVPTVFPLILREIAPEVPPAVHLHVLESVANTIEAVRPPEEVAGVVGAVGEVDDPQADKRIPRTNGSPIATSLIAPPNVVRLTLRLWSEDTIGGSDCRSVDRENPSSPPGAILRVRRIRAYRP